MIVGTLRGFDQFMNLVVDNTVEVNGDEKTDIGMVVCSSLFLLVLLLIYPLPIIARGYFYCLLNVYLYCCR
jgi:small nuclear ribonucleoprotein G